MVTITSSQAIDSCLGKSKPHYFVIKVDVDNRKFTILEKGDVIDRGKYNDRTIYVLNTVSFVSINGFYDWFMDEHELTLCETKDFVRLIFKFILEVYICD